MFPEPITEVQRVFQYDYIYVDALFLLIWLIILMKNRKHKALLFGLAVAPILYIIDAVIWWNMGAGPHYPSGVFIREYWINGIAIPHPLGSYRWIKFGADFMMTVSYALFTFPWLWIAFEGIKNNEIVSTLKYGIIWITFWSLVPLISSFLPLDNSMVTSVRHMYSQVWIWIILTLLGYGILCIAYRHRIMIPLKLFIAGTLGALIMELPLYLYHIRPMNLSVLLFDTAFMLNQAVPYLYLLYDKIFSKIKSSSVKIQQLNSGGPVEA